MQHHEHVRSRLESLICKLHLQSIMLFHKEPRAKNQLTDYTNLAISNIEPTCTADLDSLGTEHGDIGAVQQRQSHHHQSRHSRDPTRHEPVVFLALVLHHAA